MTAVIETEGLTKRFGNLVAVDGVDLTIEQGEAYGFLGPNGAGKTTTIRLLLGALQATAGRSEVLGGSGADPEIRSRIGVLGADLHFAPRHTARDELAFTAALHGGVDQGEVDSLIERFGVQPDRPLGQLSTGNKRKVAIVLAFAHRPELLVLDEPTGGLDPLLRHEFQQLVAERQAEGTTVFLSSHVLSEVQRSVRRIGIIRRGVLGEPLLVDDLLRKAAALAPLEIDFAQAPPADAFDRVAGVAAATVAGVRVTLQLDGTPVAPVLARAAELGAVHLTADHPELEDLFMSLYGEVGGGDAAQAEPDRGDGR
jgi:ABC-2 type transport system ATP-binding protein